MIYLLDMFGVAVFAISGALTDGRKGMDLFGIVVVAVVAAVGGGTLRRPPGVLDLRPQLPPRHSDRHLRHPGLRPLLPAPERLSLLVADAFGLPLFTVAGAQMADLSGVAAPIGVVMGVMTGAAGGAMRDVSCAEVPLVLRKETYATAAIAVLFVVLTRFDVPDTLVLPASMALIFPPPRRHPLRPRRPLRNLRGPLTFTTRPHLPEVSDRGVEDASPAKGPGTLRAGSMGTRAAARGPT